MDAEVRSIVARNYDRAEDILKKNIEKNNLRNRLIVTIIILKRKKIGMLMVFMSIT